MDVPQNMDVALPVPGVLALPRPSRESAWEEGLVRRCQGGDQEAFRLLVERYQGRVFSIAHTLIRRRADVEDIAQQVFTKVYFGLRHFDFRSALLTWIYKITVNECYDHLRRQRASRMYCLSEMSETEARQVQNVPVGDLLPDRKAELAQLVSLLLGKVSSEERVLLLMKEVEGYSVQELAQLFACNENTIKVKLFRARRRLVQAARKKFFRKATREG